METIKGYQNALEELSRHPGIFHTISMLASKSREHPAVLLGMSPRASLCLLKAAKARAALSGRNYAVHEDIKILLEPVLSHRIILKPEAEMDGVRPETILNSLFEEIDLWESSQ
jgi:MoxR-like ATPase